MTTTQQLTLPLKGGRGTKRGLIQAATTWRTNATAKPQPGKQKLKRETIPAQRRNNQKGKRSAAA